MYNKTNCIYIYLTIYTIYLYIIIYITIYTYIHTYIHILISSTATTPPMGSGKPCQSTQHLETGAKRLG